MNSTIYNSVGDLANLQNSTYLLAFIVAFVALGLAFLIANLIAFEGGLNPRDHVKRTWAYWLVGLISTAGFFAYNYFFVAQKVKMAFKPDFEKTALVATLAFFGVYVVTGLALSFLLKNAKFGTVKFKP